MPHSKFLSGAMKRGNVTLSVYSVCCIQAVKPPFLANFANISPERELIIPAKAHRGQGRGQNTKSQTYGNQSNGPAKAGFLLNPCFLGYRPQRKWRPSKACISRNCLVPWPSKLSAGVVQVHDCSHVGVSTPGSFFSFLGQANTLTPRGSGPCGDGSSISSVCDGIMYALSHCSRIP